MNHLKKIKKIKHEYVNNIDQDDNIKNTSNAIVSLIEKLYANNEHNYIKTVTYFFINDNDIHRQIKHNIHASLCFMKESKIINELTSFCFNKIIKE